MLIVVFASSASVFESAYVTSMLAKPATSCAKINGFSSLSAPLYWCVLAYQQGKAN